MVMGYESINLNTLMTQHSFLNSDFFFPLFCPTFLQERHTFILRQSKQETIELKGFVISYEKLQLQLSTLLVPIYGYFLYL